MLSCCRTCVAEASNQPGPHTNALLVPGSGPAKYARSRTVSTALLLARYRVSALVLRILRRRGWSGARAATARPTDAPWSEGVASLGMTGHTFAMLMLFAAWWWTAQEAVPLRV